MIPLIKLENKFATSPLFFQVFAIACGLMFTLSVYAFFVESFKEARIFLYSSLTGFLIFSLVKLATSNRNLKETGVTQLISLILLFLLLPLFLAFPTWIILPESDFMDAYLDMVGAFTTTGLPVFENDLLSRTLHLWRALVSWFGGGLILIAAFLILLPASRGGLDVLFNKNTTSNLTRKLTLNERSMTLNKISKKLIPIYLGLTLILWCLLTSFGTDGYTSLIRAFSILSTSGIIGPEKFDSDGAGFAGELVMAIFLLLAVSHNIMFSLDKKENIKNVFLNKELRLGLLTISCVTVILTIKNMSLNSTFFKLDEPLLNALKLIWGNFFTALSFMTTNGYVSSDWGLAFETVAMPHVIIILLGLCLFGGGLATTAGGIKLLRISVLFSAFSNETGKLLHPSSMPRSNINLTSLEISGFTAWIFFMLFVVSLALVTIILAMFGMLFEEALILAVSCLTTTGPIIQMFDLEPLLVSELSQLAKLVLIASMVLGRLEILVVLSVMTSAVRRA